MSDVSNMFRQKILKVIAEERQKAPQPIPHLQLEVLAEFIRLQLEKLNMNESHLAQLTNISRQDIHLLLEAKLTNEALTEDMLGRLSEALQYDVKLMRIILNRADPKQSLAR